MLKGKPEICKLLVALMLPMVSSACWAQATLTINGNVTTTPCTISSENVVLGRVPVIEFLGAGGMGSNYTKDFALTIGGCDLRILQSASLTFNGSTVQQLSNATGLELSQVAGVAQGIAITLRNNDQTHGSLGQEISFSGLVSYPVDVASEKNTYELRAAYARIPGVPLVPGLAGGSATVTITYE